MKRKLAILLAVVMLLTMMTMTVFAADTATIDAAVNDTAAYIYKTVKSPQVGSIGGEWAVLGLARSGYDVPQSYYDDYYDTVVEYVKACDGVLHEKKYTEYSRVIVALSSIGRDATNVGGYNLLTPLGDFDKTIWQGINGPIWALIALDSANYDMPVNKDAATQATRQMYIDEILSRQLADGGFSLTGTGGGSEPADPDITSMALQALAKYQSDANVKAATDKALATLSSMQDASGGLSSWGTKNSESTAQTVVALCELGIPMDDARFVKNGKTMTDDLLTYYKKGNGFLHTQAGNGSNQMATEQAFYALVAAQRAAAGKNSLYSMDDVIKAANTSTTQTIDTNSGLAGKNAAVKAMPVVKPGITFLDVSAHKNQPAIEALAARAIINGKTTDAFEPDSTMTRAEFATIVVKALGLDANETTKFTDVKSGAWYAGYVGTANTYGIVNGNSATTFNPQGTITREEAGAMVARAAKLCGMDATYDTAAARDILAGFGDYVTCSSWAFEPLAFCYDKGILDDADTQILPKTAIKRCEIAQMLYNMLGKSELI